jgi:hypothetical protein
MFDIKKNNIVIRAYFTKIKKLANEMFIVVFYCTLIITFVLSSINIEDS